MNLQPNPLKEMIPLSIGDPTAFPNLPISPEAKSALEDVLAAQKKNGYPPSVLHPTLYSIFPLLPVTLYPQIGWVLRISSCGGCFLLFTRVLPPNLYFIFLQM